jgi:hypothetical protein
MAYGASLKLFVAPRARLRAEDIMVSNEVLQRSRNILKLSRFDSLAGPDFYGPAL